MWGVLHDCGGTATSPNAFCCGTTIIGHIHQLQDSDRLATIRQEKGVYSTRTSAHLFANSGHRPAHHLGKRRQGRRVECSHRTTVFRRPSRPIRTEYTDRAVQLAARPDARVGGTLYIRLFNGRDPADAVIRLPWGYGIHLYGAHDVVLAGINVSFALVGYQIESDDRRLLKPPTTSYRYADIGYVTDGVSAAADDMSVIGMNIHDAGATKYEHGVYASEDRLVVSDSTFSRITGAPVHCNPACDHATISSPTSCTPERLCMAGERCRHVSALLCRHYAESQQLRHGYRTISLSAVRIWSRRNRRSSPGTTICSTTLSI